MKFDEMSEIREQMELLVQNYPRLSQNEYNLSDGDEDQINNGDDRIVALSPEDSEKKPDIFRICTFQWVIDEMFVGCGLIRFDTILDPLPPCLFLFVIM